MKRVVVGLILALASSVALAQWQVPDGTIPIGRGPGVVGFNSTAPSTTSTKCLLDTVPPSFGSCGGISGLANPTAVVGLSAVNGSATSAMRSDAAPPLSQAISPTMTGNWIFNPASGNAITINPAATTINRGFNITQSGPTTGNQNALINFNSINITSDQTNSGGYANTVNGLNVNMNFGGSNASGARQAGVFSVVQTAPTSATNVNRAVVGILGACTGQTGDGGTGLTVATAKGGCVGANFVAQSSGTNLTGVMGQENDVAVLGGSAIYRWGYTSISLPDTQAVLSDAAYTVGAAGGTGAIGWKNGFVITDANGGISPLSTNGCVLCTYFTAGPYTITTGIDLSAYTITGNFLVGPNGFGVSGGGIVSVNGHAALQGGGTTTLYTQLLDTAANVAIILGGGGSAPDPTNYYRNTNHVFASIGGVTTFLTLTTGATGVRFNGYGTGVLTTDATGIITANSALPAARFPALTGDVTTVAGALATTLATTQAGAHTWTATQTISPANATPLNIKTTGANASFVTIDNSQASQQSGFNLSSNGTAKWQFIKQTDESFLVYDVANALVVQQFVPGAASAGKITFLGYTTAATSTATGSLINSGGFGNAGAIYGGAEVVTGAVAVASLPACNAGRKAARHFVTDANATFTAGIGAVVAAGGANNVPVTCDGTSWRIGANDNIPAYLMRKFA